MTVSVWYGFTNGYYPNVSKKYPAVFASGKVIVDIARPHIRPKDVHSHLTYRVNISMGYVFRLDVYPLSPTHEAIMINELEHAGFKLIKRVKSWKIMFYLKEETNG